MAETDAVVKKELTEREKIDVLLLALNRLLAACDAELAEGKLSQKSYARGLAREALKIVQEEVSASIEMPSTDSR